MRGSALMMLTMRQSLDGLTAEQISRSYGLPIPEAADLLKKETLRRRMA
tara:strand:- start:403 stop:549 length:147 start_codon:yes stop_codon:yes gene_type:complete